MYYHLYFTYNFKEITAKFPELPISLTNSVFYGNRLRVGKYFWNYFQKPACLLDLNSK